MMRDNIRAPDMVVGDMEAQVAASRIGAERYLALIERTGCPPSKQRRTRSWTIRTAHAPGHRGAARRHLPGGGARGRLLDDPDRRHFKVAVAVTVKGSEMVVDLDGTARQCDDRPINMPRKARSTARSG